MSKLERINAFITVAEENGFAAAARKLGVSTASISRQISNLEADLKAVLLRRTTRTVVLTEIGTEYYQQAKKALAVLDEAENSIIDSHGEPTGTLSVMSSRYFALKHIIPKLPEFMAANPKLLVKIELAERFPDLQKENIDLIFGVSVEGSPELVHRQVTSTQYVLCASPGYLKEYGVPQIPADMSRHRYITHSMRKPDNVIVFKDGKQVYLEPVLWMNDSRAMCECAMQGIGIVKLHEYIVAKALADGRLVEVLSLFKEKEQPVYLYYQQTRFLQPKVRRFIDFYVDRS